MSNSDLLLIQLEEIPEQETDRILREPHFLDNVDVLCLTYDSADSDSFGFIADLREQYPHLNLVPTVYAATKADLDRQEQRYEFQPDTYSRLLGLQPPIHVSALWGATGDLFVQLAEAAGSPGTAVPRYPPLSYPLTFRSDDEEGWLWGTNTRLLLAAATFGGLVLSLGGSLVFKAMRNRWSSVH